MERRPDRKDRIKTEALRLFAERGVDAVTVRDIGQASGMTGPNLYAHYKSKDQLIAELFHEGYAAYGDAIAQSLAGTAPFAERLARMVHAICRLHDHDNARFRFLLIVQHGHLQNVALDARNPAEIISQALAAAMQAGEIPKRDPNLMALALIGLLVQPAIGRLYGRITGDLAPRAEDLAAMCWRVLT